MKRLLSLVCVLVLAVMLVPVSVRADVIFEPWDDSFYEDHRSECEYHSRSYTADGPDGVVIVYESPESARKESEIANGTSVWISHIYTDPDGIRWGYCDDFAGNVGGWVPMDYLDIIYDWISFDEEYGECYVEEKGQLDGQYRGKTVYFWNYPGSQSSSYMELSADQEYLPEYTLQYTDPEGRIWGKVSYYMGHRNCWICLTDPTADLEGLYPGGAPVQPASEPVSDPEQMPLIVPKDHSSGKIITIVAVAAVVAVTAALLILLKRKK